MAKHRTRKDRRKIGNFPYEFWDVKKHVCAMGWKKDLKRISRRKSRQKRNWDIPYKRLDDPYHYC